MPAVQAQVATVQCIGCGHFTLRPAKWERPGDAGRMARSGFGKCLAVQQHQQAGTYLSATWPRTCGSHSPVSPEDGELRARFFVGGGNP